jgi:hypothetical protein
MNLTVIKMIGIPLFSDPIDEFLFDEFVDPLLPGQGLPIPLPGRLALAAIELQYEAGLIIARGDVAGKDQYTGQTAAKEQAQTFGYNLVYQPGGIQI